METPVIWRAAHYLAVGAAIAAMFALDAQAQQATQVSEMPKFLFVVEHNESMNEPWSGIAGEPSRWDVVVESIIHAVNSAPVGTEFAVVTTAEDGWRPVSSFEDSGVHLSRSLAVTSWSSVSSRDIASALDGAVRDYLGRSTPGDSLTRWQSMPFGEPCSAVEIIVIGDGVGDAADTAPADATFPGDVHAGCGQADCTGVPEVDVSLLDDAAFHAANHDLNSFHAGVQTARTHTILLGSRSQQTTLAEDLFVSTADAGGGLYTRAEAPADVAIGISLAMTDALQSVLDVSASITTATGHRMFRTWTEIPGGSDSAPLHRGHVEAFQLVQDPRDARYGEINGGSLWDAAELLALRASTSGARNSYVFQGGDPATDERTLFTNGEWGGSFRPRDLVPFDNSRVEQLGPLMLSDLGDHSYPIDGACAESLEGDLNQDCEVTLVDAQHAIDFLRGVPEAVFAGSSTSTRPEHGTWKVGGMFLSTPAFSDTIGRAYTDDVAMYTYMLKLAEHDSVLYVPANDGFLHAFKVPLLDSNEDGWEDYNIDEEGGWEMWAYIPRHLLDHQAMFHGEVHSALNLLRDGESYLNDGSVNLSDVWMDGVPNRLDAECANAEPDGLVDRNGCEYHRVLVASMGLGSRYHYALDVTDPRRPRFLWEWLGDQDGWRKGMGTGTPLIANVYSEATRSDVPVVVWSGGTGDLHDPRLEELTWDSIVEWWRMNRGVGARWYMFDLLEPSNSEFSPTGYRVANSLSPYTRWDSDPRYSGGDATAGVFGTPAAVDYDEDGTIDALYMGSRHGTVFKVLLDNGELSSATMENAGELSPSTCVFHAAPQYVDAYGAYDDNQAVYYRPSVSRDRDGMIRVTWATGWPGNISEPYASGHLYSVVDGSAPGDEWTCQEALPSGCGPYFDPLLLDPGEKVVGQVQTYGGKVMFTTYVADNDVAGAACGIGHTRVYAMDLDDCTGGYVEGRDWGPDDHTVTNAMYVEFEGVPSTLSLANRGMYLNVVLPDGEVQAIGPIRPEPVEYHDDRVSYASWRVVL